MNTKKSWLLLVVLALVIAVGLPNVASAEKDTSASRWLNTPMLGVAASPMHPALAAQLGKVICEDRGVLVESVLPNSPAEKAGLKPFDILITYDGEDIASPEQLADFVHEDKAGTKVMLGYVREGTAHETTVTLAESKPRFGANRIRPLEYFWPIEQWVTVEDPAPLAKSGPVATFQAMTIKQFPDGKFSARIEFLDADKNTIEREYSGSYDEVRAAIEADKELPAAQRDQLLNSLKGHAPATGQKTSAIQWLRDWAL